MIVPSSTVNLGPAGPSESIPGGRGSYSRLPLSLLKSRALSKPRFELARRLARVSQAAFCKYWRRFGQWENNGLVLEHVGYYRLPADFLTCVGGRSGVDVGTRFTHLVIGGD